MDNSIPHPDDLRLATAIAKGVVSCAGVIKEVDLVCKYMKDTDMVAWKHAPLDVYYVLRQAVYSGEISCFEYSYPDMPQNAVPRRVYAPKEARMELCKYEVQQQVQQP